MPTKRDLYKDLRNAYNLSGPYSPIDNTGLIRHPREEQDAYDKRRKLGAFPRFLKLLIDMNTVRPIFRDPPTREFKKGEDVLSEWSEMVDGGIPAASLQVKMPRFLRQACLNGVLFVVAENHPDDTIAGRLRSELVQAKLLPYFFSVTPEYLIDLILTSQRTIERFVWLDKGKDKRGRLIDVAKIYTPTKYIVCPKGQYQPGMNLNKIKNKLEEIPNALGRVPVYPLMSVDEDLTAELPESDYNYALQACKLIYNLTSWIASNCADTAFPVFIGPNSISKPRSEINLDGDVEKQIAVDVGTTKGLRVDDDCKIMPQWIAPPNEPTTLMQEERGKIIELLVLHYAVAWWGTRNTVQSGESKKQDKGVRNETLEYLAHQCEALERWMTEMVGLYMGIETEVEVIYNTDFSSDDDIMEFIEMAITAISDDLSLAPEVRSETRKKVIRRLFSESSSDTVQKLTKFQQKWDEERRNAESVMGGFGQASSGKTVENDDSDNVEE